MTLGEKQRDFTLKVSYLIQYAYEQGYKLTFGDAYRDPRVHGVVGVKDSYSSAMSLHKSRLAVDFNLFKNGKYMVSTDDYLPLGVYWESLGDNCTWGGRFGDGNHFSVTHEGRK